LPARTIRVAVIGGDGIGPEVVAEAVKVLRAAATQTAVETTDYDLGSRRWLRTGEALPAAALSEISGHDAILFGAVGDPAVPTGVLERGLVLKLRSELGQCVSLRPVRLYPGVASPLSGVRAESVDMLVAVTQESSSTASGVQRVTRYALQRATARPRQKLTLAHTPSVLTDAGDLWRRTVDELAKEFGEVAVDYCPMDTASMYFVTHPERFDVIVTDSMFGDILTAVGAAVAGGIGLAASASVNPERNDPSTFEPVHGSAPDLASQQKADPTAAILAAAMLCEHLGLAAEAARIEQAVAEDLLDRQGAWAARSTLEIGDDIAERVAG
jgi:3-isopropylmalate dehydrogenase